MARRSQGTRSAVAAHSYRLTTHHPRSPPRTSQGLDLPDPQAIPQPADSTWNSSQNPRGPPGAYTHRLCPWTPFYCPSTPWPPVARLLRQPMRSRPSSVRVLDAHRGSPYLDRVTSPYRDENDSLRAEVARLRAALAKRRSANGGVALLLVGVDFLAALALRPWLNGASDMKFWMGLAVVVGIAFAAIVNAVGIRRA